MIPESAQPPRDACRDCGADGSRGNDCTCHGWVAVDDIARADLKALLATSNLSMGAP